MYVKHFQRRLQAKSGNKCQIDITYEYNIPIPLVGKVAEKLLKGLNEREWQTCLENLKELVEVESQASAD